MRRANGQLGADLGSPPTRHGVDTPVLAKPKYKFLKPMWHVRQRTSDGEVRRHRASLTIEKMAKAVA
jgi:hypothetical protein